MYSDNVELIGKLKNILNGMADETLSRIADSGNCGNLINIFRDCYDEFNRILFVAKNNKSYTKVHGVTGVGMIQEVLRQNGIVNSKGEALSVDHIRNLMYRVRAEQGLTKKRTPAPTPTSSRSAAKRAVLETSAPAAAIKPAPRPQTTVTLTGGKKPVEPVSAPLSEAAIEAVRNFVRPEPIKEWWPTGVDRLKKEMGLTDWCGQDEHILAVAYKSYMERRNNYDYKNMWDDHLSYPYKMSVHNETENTRSVLRNLKIKLERLGVFEFFANMGADGFVAPLMTIL